MNNTRDFVRVKGDVLFVQPKKHWVITGCLFGFILVSIFYLANGTYSKGVIVGGIITPTKGLSKVPSKSKGYLEELNIRSGDSIKKNETLAVISETGNSLNRIDTNAVILEKLTDTKKLILKEISSIPNLRSLEYDSLKIEKLAKTYELKSLRKRLELLSQQSSLAQQALLRQEELFANRFSSEPDFLAARKEFLIRNIEIEQLKSQTNLTKTQLEILKNSISRHSINTELIINKLQKSINEIEQRIIEISARRSYALKSPIDGVIAATFAKTGELVQGGQNIVTILPKDSEFQAILFVPSDAIGFIKTGQVVSIRYDSYAYQHFGIQYGTVVNVSKVVSLPSELHDAVTLDQPVFQVVVELHSQVINASGKEYLLKAGMKLNATINLEPRTLIQWLLQPLHNLNQQ